MPRRSSRPKLIDYTRAIQAFIGQGITPRIVMGPNGLIIIESAGGPLLNSANIDDELDAELIRFEEKHREI